MTAAQARAEDRAKEATFQAWQTARFTLQGRTKKGMPSLKQALGEIGQPAARRPQTAIELRAALALIVAQHGLRVKGKL